MLVGDPAYYGRFGFVNAAPLTLAGVPPEYFLKLLITDDAPAGEVEFHPAFGKYG